MDMSQFQQPAPASPSTSSSTAALNPYHSSPRQGPSNASFRSSTETLLSSSNQSPILPSSHKESSEESTSIDIGDLDRSNDSVWPLEKPSRTKTLIACITKSPSSRVYALACALAFVLLLSILSTSTPALTHIGQTIQDIDVTSIQDKVLSLGHSKSTCNDPYAMPGYIWYGKKHQDVRWVPYTNMDPETIGDPKDIELYNPEHEKRVNKTAMDFPPAAETLPIELSKLFKTVKRREENKEALEFMRNKHIMVYGSSLDREMTKMFCNDHEQAVRPQYTGGKLYEYEHHRSTYCHFADYNFTLSSVMHYGLHQTNWFRGEDADPKMMGIQAEERLEKVVVPLTHKFGKPDLFIFSSGLWDLMFFNKIERNRDPNVTRSMYLPVSYERLMWHRSRLAEVIEKIRETFPDTPLLYRTTTQPAKRRADDDDQMIAVFQMNQSARALMRLLKVPLFHWSELIKGSHSYKDFVHYETDSRQNWLYGEMLLYTLQQVSDPNADTSCWLDR